MSFHLLQLPKTIKMPWMQSQEGSSEERDFLWQRIKVFILLSILAVRGVWRRKGLQPKHAWALPDPAAGTGWPSGGCSGVTQSSFLVPPAFCQGLGWFPATPRSQIGWIPLSLAQCHSGWVWEHFQDSIAIFQCCEHDTVLPCTFHCPGSSWSVVSFQEETMHAFVIAVCVKHFWKTFSLYVFQSESDFGW